MKSRKLVCAALVGGTLSSAGAQEVYLQGGTQGAGIGAALGITSVIGIHADFNAINFSHDFTVGGNRYQDDVRLRQGGLYADLFPWRNSGFRVTGGVRFTDDQLTGVSVPTNGSYTFRGKRFPARPGQYATAEVRYPTVMPYLGIGYGHRPATKGFGFVVDLGVSYGIPRVSYTLSPALAAAAGPAKSQQIIATGLQQLRDKASPFRWYPIAQIGVSYRF